MSTISASTTSTTAYKVTADTTGTLVLQTGSTPTTAATFDANQNMGLGVTPQTWQSTSKALQIGVTGAIRGRSDANLVNMMSNFYTDSAGTNKYIVTDYATNYQQYQGTHAWYYAASGSAGGSVSFTEAMRLDASGNLGIATASPGVKLHVVGDSYASGEFGWGGTGAGASSLGFLAYTGGNSVIGSRGATALAFYTNSSERARITSAGNLGVGTTNPQQLLDVNGTARAAKYAYESNASGYAVGSSTTLTMTTASEGTVFLISASNHSGTTNVSQTMWMLSYSGNGSSVVTQIATGGNYTPTISVSGTTVTITNNSGGARIIYASYIRLQ